MSLIFQPPLSRSQKKGIKPNTPLQQHPRPGLYVGGKADAKDYDKLLQRNITHILNMTPAKETGIEAGVPNYFERSSSVTLQYKRIPIYDSALSVSDLRDQADAICEFIANALDCHQSSILIHCQQGVSRSVTAALLYLIRCVGMSYDDAMALMLRRRPTSNPIPEFRALLQELSEEVKGAAKLVDDKKQINDAATTDDANDVKEEVNENGLTRVAEHADPPTETKKRVATAMIGPQRPPKR